MYHIQYTTQIWEQIAFKIPSKTFVIASACLDCLLGFRMNGGAIVLANINQSHIKIFNRLLNGISSRSGDNITHTHARTRTHTHTHTEYIIVLNSRKKKASLDTTRKRGQSATMET